MSRASLLFWSLAFVTLTGCASVQQSPGGADLFGAAKIGDAARVRTLLASSTDPNAQGTACREAPQRGTALMAAAGGGHTEVVRLLLGAGADPNRQMQKVMQWPCNNYTALILAAKGGYADIARLLLANGADTRLRGGRLRGRSAAEWAQKAGRPDITDLIAQAEAMSLEDRKTKLGAQPVLSATAVADSSPRPAPAAAAPAAAPAPAAEPAPQAAVAPEAQPEKPAPKPAPEAPKPLTPSERKSLDSQL